MADRRSVTVRVAAALTGFVVVLLASAAVALGDETVYVCATPPYQATTVMQGAATWGINYYNTCAAGSGIGGLQLVQDGVNSEKYGQTASWGMVAPVGLGIVRAQVGDLAANDVAGTGYVASFFWDGGSRRISDGGWVTFDTLGAAGWLWSSRLGWQLACAPSQGGGCQPDSNAQFAVSDVQVDVREAPGYGPAFVRGTGLWQQSGWVRGVWPLGFGAGSVSGVCGESATLDGVGIPGTVDVSASRVQTTWNQCQAPDFAGTIDTSKVGQGPVTLELYATDAAGVTSAYPRTVDIDNSNPTVSLSGPSDAPATAGTQYVTATASGSASGIAGLACSVDGAPAHWYPGAAAQVPVSGVGQHGVRCSAADNAVDPAGNHGWSTTQSWSLKIGTPTVSGITFGRLADPPQCRRVHTRVKVPGKWVTRHRGNRLVSTYRRPHTRATTVIKCKPRTIRKQVTAWVTEHRHGRIARVKRKQWERVVVPPHVVNQPSWHARFGKGAVVSGWLGDADGTALGGRQLRVLTAPDNGLGQWSQVATVTTSPQGGWSAQLPPGPSRLVEAAYDGDATTEASVSGTVQLLVRAAVRIKITPRVLPWDSTMIITGRVLGGYVPPNSNILQVRYGIKRIGAPQGNPDIRPDGSFRIVWHFRSGHGVLSVWFLIATLKEADYPYSQGSSRKVTVVIGRPTPRARRTHHTRHRKPGRRR